MIKIFFIYYQANSKTKRLKQTNLKTLMAKPFFSFMNEQIKTMVFSKILIKSQYC